MHANIGQLNIEISSQHTIIEKLKAELNALKNGNRKEDLEF